MKKTTIALVAVSLAAVTFCGAALRERKARFDDMDRLCQYYASGAAGALQLFADDLEQGEEGMSQYWYGVSQFYAFMDALYFLPDPGGWIEAEQKDCRVLYDHMLHAPEEVLEHMDEVMAALELVGEDYDSAEARAALSRLGYTMQYDTWEAE